MMLDEIDAGILAILKTDSRLPFTEIAKIMGLSEGTVRRRIHNLVDAHVITGFTIKTKGLKPKALVLITIVPSIPTSLVAERVSKIEGVETVFEVAGHMDIVLTISRKDIGSINQGIDEIRGIDGVQQTNTLFVLREW
jgi:Lrp/AsnC family transcriptional regulator for asnA, asnC and gidA